MPGLGSVVTKVVGKGRTGETHEVYEFGNHPFKLAISEASGITGETGFGEASGGGSPSVVVHTRTGSDGEGTGLKEGKKGRGRGRGTYSKNNHIIPNNIKHQPRKQDTSRTTKYIEC